MSISPQPPAAIIAALTLARYPPRAVYGALLRIRFAQPRLRRVPGLRFWKLLGSADGAVFGPWNPCRYALLSVWVRPGKFPAKMIVAPNSPSARAQVFTAPPNSDVQASGTVT